MNDRFGKFTSSRIGKLIGSGKGKPFSAQGYSYIRSRAFERLHCRSIESQTPAKETAWGLLAEKYVFEKKLGSNYELLGDVVFNHPVHSFWAGSPDAINHDNEKAVVDVKSPFTLQSFSTLTEALRRGLTGSDAVILLRDIHDSGDDYYWQLVSNAAILGVRWAELIIFCPANENEANEIRTMSASLSEGIQSKFRSIYYSEAEELPSLANNTKYQSMNLYRFEIPESDIKLLTERILMAEELCNKYVRGEELF